MAAAKTLGGKFAKKWRDFRAYRSAFGSLTALILVAAETSMSLQRSLRISIPALPVRMRLRPLKHRFTVRLFTSDAEVVRQNIFERQYLDIESVGENGLVIDLGANIGSYAALVLSSQDDVRVVCVEPDPSNAAVARRNLAPYGRRAEVLATAIWDQPVPLRLEHPPVRGHEWGIRVRPARDGETPDVNAVTVDEILEREGRARIDVLKVDIEGAEEQLFAGKPSWLDAVDVLAIEFHGPAAQRCVEQAVGSTGWSRESRGEIELFRRSTGRAASAGE